MASTRLIFYQVVMTAVVAVARTGASGVGRYGSAGGVYGGYGGYGVVDGHHGVAKGVHGGKYKAYAVPYKPPKKVKPTYKLVLRPALKQVLRPVLQPVYKNPVPDWSPAPPLTTPLLPPPPPVTLLPPPPPPACFDFSPWTPFRQASKKVKQVMKGLVRPLMASPCFAPCVYPYAPYLEAAAAPPIGAGHGVGADVGGWTPTDGPYGPPISYGPPLPPPPPPPPPFFEPPIGEPQPPIGPPPFGL